MFKNKEEIPSDKIRIVTSVYPLSEFVQLIGGDLVHVQSITPNGTEPHDYEPSPRDIESILTSQLFIVNGNGLDKWTDRINNDLNAKNIPVLNFANHFQQDSEDPHYWLDPELTKQQFEILRETLITLDPLHADVYKNNAESAILQTNALINAYTSGLTSCSLDQAIVSHNAFSFLGKRFNITFLPISGLSPDAEPTASKIAELSTIARTKKIKHIFAETLVSSRLSQTIAQEVGARVLTLNPLEGLTQTQQKRGETYFSIMMQNLENLRTGLQCN